MPRKNNTNNDMTLTTSDPQVKQYVAEFTATNKKLHSQLVKCQVENLSLKNRIKAYEKELKEERSKSTLADLVNELQGKVLRPKTPNE
jgi:uncharacterized protein YlxW (UPF0749 family)